MWGGCDVGVNENVSEQVIRAVLDVVVAEPSTGVSVFTSDGRWLFMNMQLARILGGADADPAQFTGRRWADVMPEERLMLMRQASVAGKPVQLRSVWRDYQTFAWMSPVRLMLSRSGQGQDAGPDLFVSTTRRAAADEEEERLVPSQDYIRAESKVMNLVRLNTLSKRELEVLALLGQGLTVKESAKVLFRSERTLERHRDAIHEKLGVSGRPELVKIAARAGLTLADAGRMRCECARLGGRATVSRGLENASV